MVDSVTYFYIIGTMETEVVLRALAALAQDTRLAIFRLLVQQGPQGLAAGEIVDRLELANATASFHLKELTHAGLATPHQAGRFIYYSANYLTMNRLIAYLTENCCKGVTCDIACAPGAARRNSRAS
jgi:ArsR family transcriptional regulator, arsenate/arsenite/antimonite-responsive transcriptional repressor